ncbi:MAG TPA: ester cyclase [Solirubrobacterales bacterium]|nr:ester cyclase [Solirubrobacterales bacterium]
MATTRKKGAKAVARSYFEAVAARDVEAMVEHWEPGGIDHVHGIADLRVPEGYRGWFGNLFRAFPDFGIEVLDVVGAGELAAVRWRVTGTFTGPARFEGLAPTGARVEVEGCDMLTVRDGLIHSNHAYTNGAELARQLGALPAGGSPAERGMIAAVNARTSAADAIRKLRDRR